MAVKAYYDKYKRWKRLGAFKLQEVMVIELLLEIRDILKPPKKTNQILTVKNKKKSVKNKDKHYYG